MSSSYTFDGDDISAGTFTGGLASGIGIAEGITITSGDASGAVGPNDNGGFTGDGTVGRSVGRSVG